MLVKMDKKYNKIFKENINKVNNNGVIPLLSSCKNRHIKVVKYLFSGTLKKI